MSISLVVGNHRGLWEEAALVCHCGDTFLRLLFCLQQTMWIFLVMTVAVHIISSQKDFHPAVISVMRLSPWWHPRVNSDSCCQQRRSQRAPAVTFSRSILCFSLTYQMQADKPHFDVTCLRRFSFYTFNDTFTFLFCCSMFFNNENTVEEML